MNIFVLDLNPEFAARYHCDKHVVKMTLETAQLLCTTHWLFDKNKTGLYLPTHEKHPCTVWLTESIENYKWALSLFFYLAREYKNRYKKEHMAYKQMYGKMIEPPVGIPEIDRTPFAQAMPDKYKDSDPVKAYRAYYIGEKSKIATWSRPATIPYWFNNGERGRFDVKNVTPEQLEREVLVHRYLYYVFCETLIDDYEYDVIERAARAVLPETSPVQKVGSSLPSSYPQDIIDEAEYRANN